LVPCYSFRALWCCGPPLPCFPALDQVCVRRPLRRVHSRHSTRWEESRRVLTKDVTPLFGEWTASEMFSEVSFIVRKKRWTPLFPRQFIPDPRSTRRTSFVALFVHNDDWYYVRGVVVVLVVPITSPCTASVLFDARGISCFFLCSVGSDLLDRAPAPESFRPLPLSPNLGHADNPFLLPGLQKSPRLALLNISVFRDFSEAFFFPLLGMKTLRGFSFLHNDTNFSTFFRPVSAFVLSDSIATTTDSSQFWRRPPFSVGSVNSHPVRPAIT